MEKNFELQLWGKSLRCSCGRLASAVAVRGKRVSCDLGGRGRVAAVWRRAGTAVVREKHELLRWGEVCELHLEESTAQVGKCELHLDLKETKGKVRATVWECEQDKVGRIKCTSEVSIYYCNGQGFWSIVKH